MPAIVRANSVLLPSTAHPSAPTHLSAEEGSPDQPLKRLSPSFSPVLSDHQLPKLGSLSQRTSVSSDCSSAAASSASDFAARAISPPLRALRRRSKSVSSFSSMLLQHSASLPVLMKPYGLSTPPALPKPLAPLSDTCSPLNIPTEAHSLPSLHPCLSPSVAQAGGGGGGMAFLRPRSKSFSVYENEQAAAAAAAAAQGRISARLPTVRSARITERPAVHVIFDKRNAQPLVESKEEEEFQVVTVESADGGSNSGGGGEGKSQQMGEFATCPVNPMLSPIVEVDKEFFPAFSP